MSFRWADRELASPFSASIWACVTAEEPVMTAGPVSGSSTAKVSASIRTRRSKVFLFFIGILQPLPDKNVRQNGQYHQQRQETGHG